MLADDSISKLDLEERLACRLTLREVRELALWAADAERRRMWIWCTCLSDDRRKSVNALWTLTHFPDSGHEWLMSLRDEMIDRLLVETDVAKRRMLLQILREQEYEPDEIRGDFLDYCLSKINSEHEPYAIRCFSIYAAYKMCRHFPELISELEQHIEMMEFQPLSPGLKSALRQTRAKIKRLKMLWGKRRNHKI